MVTFSHKIASYTQKAFHHYATSNELSNEKFYHRLFYIQDYDKCVASFEVSHLDF